VSSPASRKKSLQETASRTFIHTVPNQINQQGGRFEQDLYVSNQRSYQYAVCTDRFHASLILYNTHTHIVARRMYGVVGWFIQALPTVRLLE